MTRFEKPDGLFDHICLIHQAKMGIGQSAMGGHALDFGARHADAPIVWAGEEERGERIIGLPAREDTQWKGRWAEPIRDTVWGCAKLGTCSQLGKQKPRGEHIRPFAALVGRGEHHRPVNLHRKVPCQQPDDDPTHRMSDKVQWGWGIAEGRLNESPDLLCQGLKRIIERRVIKVEELKPMCSERPCHFPHRAVGAAKAVKEDDRVGQG